MAAGLLDVTKSVTPTPVGLTDGATFTCPIPNGSPVIELHNESPFRVYIGVQVGSFSQQVIIPPTCVLHDCDLVEQLGATANSIIMTLKAEALLGGTAVPDYVSNQLKVFAKDYPAGPMSITSLVRNVGSSIQVAQVLLGSGQTYGVTTLDNTANPQIQPAVKACNLFLACTDNAGNADVTIGLLNPVSAGNVSGAIQFFSPVTFMQDANNQGPGFLQGLGVPAIAKAVVNQQVSSTGSISLFSTTPTPAGLYRVSASAFIINGVSGNAITLQLGWTDPGNNARTQPLPMMAAGGTAFTFMNGVNSIANNEYTGFPLEFATKAGTAITLTYRDPTNSPNDQISFSFERIA